MLQNLLMLQPPAQSLDNACHVKCLRLAGVVGPKLQRSHNVVLPLLLAWVGHPLLVKRLGDEWRSA